MPGIHPRRYANYKKLRKTTKPHIFIPKGLDEIEIGVFGQWHIQKERTIAFEASGPYAAPAAEAQMTSRALTAGRAYCGLECPYSVFPPGI
ncbi:MAG: hypothetical protein AAGB35_09540 [Pseudomonadota bacterium]